MRLGAPRRSPYIVFLLVPVEMATHTAVTGYNRQGLLCERLRMGEIRECRAQKKRWQQRRDAAERRLQQKQKQHKWRLGGVAHGMVALTTRLTGRFSPKKKPVVVKIGRWRSSIGSIA